MNNEDLDKAKTSAVLASEIIDKFGGSTAALDAHIALAQAQALTALAFEFNRFNNLFEEETKRGGAFNR